jgi:uncharacterized protein
VSSVRANIQENIIKSLATGDKRKVDASLCPHHGLPCGLRKATAHDRQPEEGSIRREIDMTRDIQFIADVMLGKLTKWLRVMGIDVLYDPDATDVQLLRRAECRGRILLTRDRHMVRRRGVPQCLYIESDYYHEQVRQVIQAFHLADRLQLFSRCLQCNQHLDAVHKEVVADRVPPYVYATQIAFKYCAICHRVYWGGTHRDNMLRQLQAMLNGVPSIGSEPVY